MTTKMKYLTLLIEPDLLEEVDSVVEELRKEGVKPKRNSGVQTISRSEVVCMIIREFISEWKKRYEEKRRKIRMEIQPNPYSIYPPHNPVEFGDGTKWGG